MNINVNKINMNRIESSSNNNITFLSFSEYVLYSIIQQVHEWLHSGSDKFLNTERLRFYVLVSGALTLSSEGGSQLVNVCETLEWKRQYGLHLWWVDRLAFGGRELQRVILGQSRIQSLISGSKTLLTWIKKIKKVNFQWFMFLISVN